jgi:tungstate transport system permease protein
MGLPPVTVGVIVTLLLWRNGPFGDLRLLYTPTAMILAQAAIAAPIVTSLTLASMQGLDPRFKLQLMSLGASRVQSTWWLLREARLPILAAVMAGFGAVISEVGAAMMVGGNVKGETRVLTTATVLEVGRGHYDIAVALSIVLLIITYTLNLTLTWVQQRQPGR